MKTKAELREKARRLSEEGKELSSGTLSKVQRARLVTITNELEKTLAEINELEGENMEDQKGRARMLIKMLHGLHERPANGYPAAVHSEDGERERKAIVAELRDIQKNDSRLELEIEEAFSRSTGPVSRPGQGGDGGFLSGVDGGLHSQHSQRTVKGRDYRSLFGAQLDTGGWSSFDEFSDAIQRGLNDDRLSRSLVEGTPSDGGFLVPTEWAAQIFDVALENEVVRPLATVYPMSRWEKKIPATVIGDHSANLYGGVISYWENESATMTAGEPTFRSMTLTARKLTNFGISSTEFLEDAIRPEQTIQETFTRGMSWFLDKAFLNGTGAGQPLGIMNSPCLISVAKEGGQAADTIQYENFTNMVGRLHPACFARSVWVVHPTCVSPLLELSLPIGTGGSAIAVIGKDGKFTLLTRPVIVSEKMQPIGDKGDIMLADFSQYAIGLRKEMRLESSIHVKFASDEIAFRCICRVDGLPLWDEALTLEDGTTTVGPFVTLVERT